MQISVNNNCHQHCKGLGNMGSIPIIAITLQRKSQNRNKDIRIHDDVKIYVCFNTIDVFKNILTQKALSL